MRRKRMSKKGSKRNFRKNAGTKKRNYSARTVMRGGYRM